VRAPSALWRPLLFIFSNIIDHNCSINYKILKKEATQRAEGAHVFAIIVSLKSFISICFSIFTYYLFYKNIKVILKNSFEI